jgi:hypothetical protein
MFPKCRTLLQNVVPRVVALAQSFPWFLVIVDCGRITIALYRNRCAAGMVVEADV